VITIIRFLNIETERNKSGLSKKELSAKLGIHEKTYYNWIEGKVDIPSSGLKRMAEFFGVKMEYLLAEETDTPKAVPAGAEKGITFDGLDEAAKKVRRLNDLLEEAEQIIGELRNSKIAVKY